MEKEFIPYEQALELKELGFDEPCFSYYKNGQLSGILEEVINSEMRNVNNEIDDYISAPLYQQAFKFFRDKYKLSSWIYNSDLDKYFFTVLQNGRIIKANQSTDSYELAELACLNKLIKICKNEQ